VSNMMAVYYMIVNGIPTSGLLIGRIR
jgi:hypothetical protein